MYTLLISDIVLEKGLPDGGEHQQRRELGGYPLVKAEIPLMQLIVLTVDVVDEVEVVDINSARFLYDLKANGPSEDEEHKGHYVDNHGSINGQLNALFKHLF